jgi:hypothetical protein
VASTIWTEIPQSAEKYQFRKEKRNEKKAKALESTKLA